MPLTLETWKRACERERGRERDIVCVRAYVTVTFRGSAMCDRTCAERTLVSSRGRVVLARGIGCLHSTHCQFAVARLACLKSIALRSARIPAYRIHFRFTSAVDVIPVPWRHAKKNSRFVQSPFAIDAYREPRVIIISDDFWRHVYAHTASYSYRSSHFSSTWYIFSAW